MLLNDTSDFGVVSMSESEIVETDGGLVPLVGAAAILAGGAMTGGALIVGVAIGVGLYYGVKALID